MLDRFYRICYNIFCVKYAAQLKQARQQLYAGSPVNE